MSVTIPREKREKRERKEREKREKRERKERETEREKTREKGLLILVVAADASEGVEEARSKVVMELRSGAVLPSGGSEEATTTTTMTTTLLPAGHLEQLCYGVRLVFSRWTALLLAVENQWGGPQSPEKARDLVERTVQWLLSKKKDQVYDDELEDFFDSELMDNWNTQAEDDSPREVARLVCQVWYETAQGRGDLVNALAASQTQAHKQIEQNVLQVSHVAAGDNNNNTNRRRREKPQVDEDGWTTV